jgi:hypothetical protein
MKFLPLSILLICFTHTSYGQNGIQLHAKYQDATRFVQENSSIKLKTIDGRKIKGSFSVAPDSSLLIKGKEIPLSEIAHFKLPEDDLKRRKVGFSLLGIGGVAMTTFFISYGITLHELCCSVYPVRLLAISPFLIYVRPLVPISFTIGIPLSISGAMLIRKKKYPNFAWDYTFQTYSNHHP